MKNSTMDTTKVEMLRSIKGKDMLLVDDYIYHYDGRNSTSFRWVCSRRRDSVPCRARIHTILINEWDLTRHRLETMVGEHPHGPAEQGTISIAREKKRQADAKGLPCTLSNSNLPKHKFQGLEAKKMVKKKRKSLESDNSDDDEEDDTDDSSWSTDVVRVMPKPRKRSKKKKLKRKFKRLEAKKKVQKKRIMSSESDTSDYDDDDHAIDNILKADFVKVKPKTTADKPVMLLKSTKDYHMIAVEGCVYRLDGKSIISCTYRWKCLRSNDLECTGRVYTECLANGMHRFKPFRLEENRHNHLPYSDAKIDALIKRNNIKILQDKDESLLAAASKVSPSSSDNKKPKVKLEKTDNQQSPLSVGKGSGNDLNITADTNQTSGESSFLLQEKAEPKITYRCVQDPHDALNEPRDGNVVKFFFLPSVKGNRILILENMIFHYDSRGSTKNRAHWTCMLRRDKQMKCNCRLTTESKGDNTQIVQVTGEHSHALNHREQIEKRIAAKGKNDGDDEVASEQEDRKDAVLSKALAEFLTLKANETDPFHDAVEFVEMERVDTSPNDADYESKHDHDDGGLPSASQRPQRKRKRPSKYDDDDDDPEYIPEPKFQSKDQIYSGKKPISEDNVTINPDNIDITKVSKLHSTRGGEMLCLDGFIYYMKYISSTTRTNWVCIKLKTAKFKCPARVTTITTDENKLKVVDICNKHTHGILESDIKKRLFHEFAKPETESDSMMEKPDFGELLGKHIKNNRRGNTNIKLYAVSDGPPSLAVRMCLKALDLPYELCNVNYIASEHKTEEYEKMNPQKEIPVLDDDGFFLSESIAIMQYLCDKYATNEALYPDDVKDRALVNHRLCFNMSYYYSSISAYTIAPILFDSPRTELGLKKVKNSLTVFETYLKRLGTKYAAGNRATIADIALVASTLCLEAIDFDLTPCPFIKKWYETFKKDHKELWEIAGAGMQEIKDFESVKGQLNIFLPMGD